MPETLSTRLLIAGDTAPYIRLFNTLDWSVVDVLPAVSFDAGAFVRDVTYSPNGAYAAVTMSSGNALVFETDTWTVVYEFLPIESGGSYSNPRMVAFSHDGTQLTVVYYGTAAVAAAVYRLADWVLVHEIPFLGDAIFYCAAYSPDDDQLAFGRQGSTGSLVLVYETAGWTLAQAPASAPSGNSSGVLALCFSPDGKWLAASKSYSYIGVGGIYVLSTSDWSLITMPQVADSTHKLSFDPTSSKLSTVGWFDQMGVIAVGTWQRTDYAVTGFGNSRNTDISADGKYMVALSRTQIAVLELDTGIVTVVPGVSVSDDSSYMALSLVSLAPIVVPAFWTRFVRSLEII